MFKNESDRRGGVVLGVDDDGASRQAVIEAAAVAAREGLDLHLVTGYVLHDSWSHRASRAQGPQDISYQLTPKGDAEFVVRELAGLARSTGVTVHEHVYRGSLRAGVRKVTKALAGRPVPVAAPVAVPAPIAPPVAVPEPAHVPTPVIVRIAS